MKKMYFFDPGFLLPCFFVLCKFAFSQMPPAGWRPKAHVKIGKPDDNIFTGQRVDAAFGG